MKTLNMKTVCGWAVVAMALASCADVASTRYIRAGLVGQYDGIDNAGVGVHSSSAATWTDLSGNGNDGTFDTANISWTAKGWTYSRGSTLNNIKPVTLTSAIGSVINSKKFTVESTVNTTYVSGKNPGTRCGLFGNYAGQSGFSFELTANKELRYYLVSQGKVPNVLHVFYVVERHTLAIHLRYLDDVLLVSRAKDDVGDAGTFRSENLLLDATYWQHLAA